MRFLANENISAEIVDALRRDDHNVLWIRTEAAGSADEVVLARAQAEDRVVLTCDKDFGELAFRFGLPATSGILLIRIPATSPGHLEKVVMTALRSRTDWRGMFSVVEEGRVRMTPLPQKEKPL